MAKQEKPRAFIIKHASSDAKLEIIRSTHPWEIRDETGRTTKKGKET